MNIRTKLLGGFFCVWFGLSSVLLYTDFLHNRTERDRFNQIAADLTNDAVANTLVQSMSGQHKGAEVQSLLNAMAGIGGFHRAEVMDMNGTPVWSSGTPPMSRDRDRELIAAASVSGTASRTTPDNWVVVRLLPRQATCLPCHAGAGQWVGATLTEAGADPRAHQAQTQADINLLLFALGTGLVGLTGAWLVFNRSLVRPLAGIAAKFQAITPENWTAARILPTGEGEVGVLAAHFNGMLDRLAQSEDQYRRLVENMHEGICVTDDQERTTFVNTSMARMLGYTPREMLGRPLASFMDAHGKERCTNNWERLRRGVREEISCAFIRKDGQRVLTTIQSSSIHDETGHCVGASSVVQDITESQQAVDEREGILRTTLDGFLMVNGVGRIVDVNDAYCQLVGYSRAELLTMALSDVEVTKTPQDTLERVQRIVEQGGDRFETQHRRKDGRLVDLEVSANHIGEGRVFVFLRDITARREAEERLSRSEAQLRQSQKMEAMGRLAGGIAHDFNNLLTVILGYSDFVLESMSEKDPWRADIEEIRKAGTRAASLTRQMLAFSRKQVLELKLLDINAVAVDTKNMLRRLIGEDVELSVVTSPKPAYANVDEGHMEQLLLNLAVNARDAMPTGGTLIIEVSVIRLDEAYAHTHGTVQPGTYVVLAVSDTGCGMSEEVQAHLFEPFFTTKERGKGTGLGLSTVYGIVTQSGGHISVYSEVGHGTSVKVYLPYVGDAAGMETAIEPSAPSFAGTAVILLVEDDIPTRKLTSRMLVQDGFTVLEAGTGEEALSLCQRHAGPIQLMLTDVVLPKMTGPELAGHVESLRPGTRVIFMSGYTDHAVLASHLLELGKAFIQKPFSPASLIQKIRDALASPR